jgi:hypothetical protein
VDNLHIEANVFDPLGLVQNQDLYISNETSQRFVILGAHNLLVEEIVTVDVLVLFATVNSIVFDQSSFANLPGSIDREGVVGIQVFVHEGFDAA